MRRGALLFGALVFALTILLGWLSTRFEVAESALVGSPKAWDYPSLAHKAAQLLVVGFEGTEAPLDPSLEQTMRELGLGGVILFERDFNSQGEAKIRNIRSPEQLRGLTQHLESMNRTPLLVGIDQEGGQVRRLRSAFGFGDARSAASLGKQLPSETFGFALNTASRLRSLGINLNFAPVVDLARNPANPVVVKTGRSYSADPSVVQAHASQYVEAHRHCGVRTSLKHFPGHGSSGADSHAGMVDITESWRADETLPFKAMIESGHAESVMLGHLYLRDWDASRPASLSAVAVERLRGWGHEGPIFTDDLQMKAIRDEYPTGEAIRYALQAGADMLVFGRTSDDGASTSVTRLVNLVVEAIEAGHIDESRIDAALRRIEAFKSFPPKNEACSLPQTLGPEPN